MGRFGGISENVSERIQRAEELIERLVAHAWLVVAKVALWKTRLTTYETARSLELERGRELDADCRRLQPQLPTVEEQLAATQAKLVETRTTN